jgi:hypothetical protein
LQRGDLQPQHRSHQLRELCRGQLLCDHGPVHGHKSLSRWPILGCGRFCVHCLRGGTIPSLHGTERVCCLRRGDLRKQRRLNRMRQLQRGHLRSHDRQLQRKQLQFMRGRALLVVRSVGLHVVWHRHLHGHHRGIVVFVL